MKTYFTLILLIASTSVFAQVSIKPGDQLIRYNWIKPSHDFYRNVITDSAGNVKYDFMMEDFTSIDTIHKQIIFARSRQVPPGNFSTDTSVTDLFLKPLRMHEIHYQRNVSYDMRFDETQAAVTSVRKGVSTLKTYPMKSGYFEDNMIEYIFGYLELKKGVTYTLDNFNKDTKFASDPYTVRFAFDDVWTAIPDHRLYCMVLYFTNSDTSGYIWIDKSTHMVVKAIGNFKNGSYTLTKI